MPFQADEAHLLDRFSNEDLKVWERKTEALNNYWIRLFYFLEGQRKIHEAELCAALRTAKPHHLILDEWARVVDYRYSTEPLSAKGSMQIGGRFNIGSDINSAVFSPFPALYVADNYNTAYAERFGTYRTRVSPKLSGEALALRSPQSFAQVRVKGELHSVFNLNRLANLAAFVNIIRKFEMPIELKELANELEIRPPWLITKPSELRRALMDINWRMWPIQYEIPANSQLLGRLLVACGYEAVVYNSAKSRGMCTAIFLENFGSSESYIELLDPAPPIVTLSRLDKNTYKELF